MNPIWFMLAVMLKVVANFWIPILGLTLLAFLARNAEFQ